MEQLLKKVSDYIKKSSLSSEEKKALRVAILSRISTVKKVQTEFSWLVMFRSQNFRVAVASFLVTVSFGGSLAFAAEKSLPGDLLYLFKTDVNEKVVRAFTSNTPEKVAEYEAVLLDRRLVEAEILDREDRLSGELEKKVRKVVSLQKVKARNKAMKLFEEDVVSFQSEISSEPSISATLLREPDEGEKFVEKASSEIRKERNDESEESLEVNIETGTKADILEIPGEDGEKKEAGNVRAKDKVERRTFEKVMEKHRDIISRLDLEDEAGGSRDGHNKNREDN